MTRSRSRILFASSHCVIDYSSGAAIATADALKLLARVGFECRAFCAAKLDLEAYERFEQILADIRLRARFHSLSAGNRTIHLLRVDSGVIPIEVLRTQSTRIHEWSPDEPHAMLAAFERIAGDFRPHVLLTYGGDPVTQTMIRLAQQRGVAVVFALHNFAYHDASMFRGVDRVIVPSEFSRRWYEQKLGLKCHVLPYAIDWQRVESRATRVESQQKYVTFVNPQPAKGVFIFVRIAEQLQRRRPDIPILVVESRGGAAWLERTDVDLSWASNLHAMANTHDPRDFYDVTKVLLMPSLWNESVGLVAVEAMINGIPVLASDRGALPETLGGNIGSFAGTMDAEQTQGGGFQFYIPERYTPETAFVPTAQEVEPWVQTIIQLWDDEGLYREYSEKAIAQAQRWHPDRLGPVYADFFRNVNLKPPLSSRK